MDNEILQILREMQSSIQIIGTKVDSLEARFDSLEARFDSLETKVDSLEIGQKELKSDVKEIKSKLENIYDQTAHLTEFRTEVNTKLDTLKDLENVTKENCYEIAKLRAVN